MTGRLPRRVRIRYRRPPDRTTVYEQWLVFEDGHVKVTLQPAMRLDPPLRIGGRTVLEDGSDAVWFTFPGAWHDIGRFHRADGSFTGIYANVIVPCVFEPGDEWDTTDLFLDVWLPGDGAEPVVLDADELHEGERRGWVSAATAARARAEARSLVDAARRGMWPPPIVARWTRERAAAALEAHGRGPSRRGPSRAQSSGRR